MKDSLSLPGGVTPGKVIELLEQRTNDLHTEIAMIDFQLGDPERRDADGNVMDWRSYMDWKRSAIFAKRKKEEEIRDLKLKRKQVLKLGQKLVLESEDTLESHLARTCRILARLAEMELLEVDEQDILDQARAYMRRTYGDNCFGGMIN
jgi:hypothetical protein